MKFQGNSILNDDSGRTSIQWSTKRSDKERLRHRPHISNTSNSRGNEYVQYYSSLDADILFGGQFIDEVLNIAWQVQQNAMPIFGYNSYTFDDIAVGSRMVSGQFTVNFTEANYLSRVLSTLTAISRKTYNKDVPAQSVYAEVDKRRRNLPMWDKGFDIVIGFGEKTASGPQEYNQVTMLDCCQITGCTQQLDYNGEPLTETYTFIARDMKFTYANQFLPSVPDKEDSVIEEAASEVVMTGEIIKPESKLNLYVENLNLVYSDPIKDSSLNLRFIIEELGNISYIMDRTSFGYEYKLSTSELDKLLKAMAEADTTKVQISVKYNYLNQVDDKKSEEEQTLMLNIVN